MCSGQPTNTQSNCRIVGSGEQGDRLILRFVREGLAAIKETIKVLKDKKARVSLSGSTVGP